MTIRFLSDVGTEGGTESNNVFDINSQVYKLQTKIPKEKTNFGNAISRSAKFKNFAGLSVLMWEMNPENFKLISQRLAILEKNL